MKKDTTSNLCNDFGKAKKVVAPSAQALAFIKQFARGYYVEKKLPVPISGICIN